MWYRKFITRIRYLTIFLILLSTTAISQKPLPYDTTIYSGIDTFIKGNDTIVYFIHRNDFDFQKAARNLNYRKALELISQERYDTLESELDIPYVKAFYYSRLGDCDSAMILIEEFVKRNDFILNKTSHVFKFPDLIACIDNNQFLELRDTFFARNYNDLPNLNVTKHLWLMKMKDQSYSNLHDIILSLGIEKHRTLWDSIGNIKKRFQQENEVDLMNIIDSIGWPTTDRVGNHASNAAFLIVQHSSDTSFQSIILDTLKKYALLDKIDRSSYAYLKDRYLIRSGEKQLYGTQLQKFGKDSIIISPHVPVEDVLKNREEFDMISWEQYLGNYDLDIPENEIDYSENMVINPSFEIPTEYPEYEYSKGYRPAANALGNDLLGNDYFERPIQRDLHIRVFNGETCVTLYTTSKTGKITSNSYIIGTFSEPLIAGQQYKVSFYNYMGRSNPFAELISFVLLEELPYMDSTFYLNDYQYCEFERNLRYEWQKYEDTITVNKKYKYFMIGTPYHKINYKYSEYFNRSKRNQEYIDLITVKAINEEE